MKEQNEIPCEGYYNLGEKLYNPSRSSYDSKEEIAYSKKNIFTCHQIPNSQTLNLAHNNNQKKITMATISWILANRENCFPLNNLHLDEKIRIIQSLGKELSQEEFIASITESCLILYNAMHPYGGFATDWMPEYQKRESLKAYSNAEEIRTHFNLDEKPILQNLLKRNYERSLSRHLENEHHLFIENAIDIAKYGLKNETLIKRSGFVSLKQTISDIHTREQFRYNNGEVFWHKLNIELGRKILTKKEISNQIEIFLNFISPTSQKEEINMFKTAIEKLKN